jgi:hypothetical protein
VLKAIKRHSALCGNARATSGKRMCSASIRTITNPRKASSEISRVPPSALGSGSATGASATGLATCALSIVKSSYDQQRTDAKTFSFLPEVSEMALKSEVRSPENPNGGSTCHV